jgi:hypothetical protein
MPNGRVLLARAGMALACLGAVASSVGSSAAVSDITPRSSARDGADVCVPPVHGSAVVDVYESLMRRAVELDEQRRNVDAENRELAELCVNLQAENDALNNVYVASHRLHATLDPAEVMKAITEVLIDLVGAEEFAIMVLDDSKGVLRRVASEGPDGQAPQSAAVSDEPFARLIAAGQPVYLDPAGPGGSSPLAAVPLDVSGRAVGLILLYKLLRQKKGFSPTDLLLLQLLAAQAATALVSARLHGLTSRRLKTLEGFFHLFKGEADAQSAPAVEGASKEER